MSEWMEEYFEIFTEKVGDACFRREVPTSSLDKYKNILPSRLLTHWKNYGWAGYGDGIFWTVNPEEYEGIVHSWLLGSNIAEASTFHVIARSAFGDLYLWQGEDMQLHKNMLGLLPIQHGRKKRFFT